MTPPRRPGRPPLVAGDVPTRLHVSVPSQAYDQAHALARRHGMSLAELVRRCLRRALADDAKAAR
jgi:hypothetical protein